MSLLAVENLSLAIHDSRILNQVSFQIGEAEIFGLVGESGSGKSMTALSIMQLLPAGAAAGGAAWFGGANLLDLSERRMCALRGNQIGMIFQEPMTALNPVQTIGDQVAETLIVHGAADRRDAARAARERLDRVGLNAERFPLSRYPHELSGGQRQRVCIAMAIALRPRLLIADEPTTALDVTTQAHILGLLKGLVRDEQMSLLLITHDLGVVAQTADRVAVMQEGRIVETGETEYVFRDRAHAYTRKLFAAVGHVPQRAARATRHPLLEVRGVTRDYRLPKTSLFAPANRVRAVNGVDLSLNSGESLGLVGESGCGKSTLSRAILGLEAVQAGEIRLDRDPVEARHVPASVRRKMQVVFQDPFGSFNPRHRVARLIAEPFHLLDAPPRDGSAQVAEALLSVGLRAEDGSRFIHEFSGGQRQRIAIARALVIRPKLIILDEAVSALDVSIRAQILDLLADLQEKFGLSYLFISHDLSVVRAITDRVLVMRAGEIVEQGATARVFADPRHPYTKELIAATPRIPDAWQERQIDGTG